MNHWVKECDRSGFFPAFLPSPRGSRPRLFSFPLFLSFPPNHHPMCPSRKKAHQLCWKPRDRRRRCESPRCTKIHSLNYFFSAMIGPQLWYFPSPPAALPIPAVKGSPEAEAQRGWGAPPPEAFYFSPQCPPKRPLGPQSPAPGAGEKQAHALGEKKKEPPIIPNRTHPAPAQFVTTMFASPEPGKICPPGSILDVICYYPFPRSSTTANKTKLPIGLSFLLVHTFHPPVFFSVCFSESNKGTSPLR